MLFNFLFLFTVNVNLVHISLHILCAIVPARQSSPGDLETIAFVGPLRIKNIGKTSVVPIR